MYSVKFNYEYPDARTLDPDDLGTHPDGWTVKGHVTEDYYEWVNAFHAQHPSYGLVYGDFEETVYATSEEGYDHFVKHHPPRIWDYQDI